MGKIKDDVGFKGLNDIIVKNVILGLSNSLVIIVSIVSAMYVFTHREQKSISPSASIKSGKNALVVIFITALVLTLLFGHSLSTNYETLLTQGNKSPLEITNLLHKRVLLWITSLLGSIYLFIKLLRYLLSSMSINSMLINSIVETRKNLILIAKFYKKPGLQKLLNGVYNESHYNIESVFQNLKFVAENNMNKEFEESIEEFQKVISIFHTDNESLKMYDISSYLLKRDDKHYINLYSSLLRNTLSLINFLYKNQHYNKGRRVVKLYFSLYTNEEETLKKFFILSLKEFLDSIDTNSNRQTEDFLTGLNSIPLQEILIIYKKLLTNLINDNNIKMLTKVVYKFKDRISDRKKEQSSRNSSPLKISNVVPIENFVVIILLQCLLRSIEISHYASTGFLIKYLVTNYKPPVINKCFDTLKRNPGFFTKVFDSSTYIVSSELDEIETREFNEETYDYCGKKLYILLYGQHQFSIKNQLWFLDGQDGLEEIKLREEFKNCTYSAYIYNKVLAASKSYGLIFFKDTEVMHKIMSEIGIEEKEIVLSN
ncbi:hypothetical protein ACTHO0_18880 [Cytobacillus praedii]|uniref:hypothetical protein n=1 Tax=Cytobacillus praedii TaxID=1742358 RepID=UPI003F7D7C71